MRSCILLIQILAIDFGASSGRAVLGRFDGKRITLHEIKRFSNDPVAVHGTLYWDVLRLFYEIKESIVIATKTYGDIDSIAVDTWGVDFGLLNEAGELIQNPVHYRDVRTRGIVGELFKKLPKEEGYSITGNQIMEFNTAFQLMSVIKNKPYLMEQARHLLFMPDLFNYFLTGVMQTEETIASTSQLYDISQKAWSPKIIEAIGIPNILGKPVKSGTIIGQTAESLNQELGIAKPIDVIAVCSHDTQSAIVAVPTEQEDFVYLSCGTWSLLGTEMDLPILDKKSMDYNITNEACYGGKVSFLKNITGLFILSECKKQWEREGTGTLHKDPLHKDLLSYEELSQLAEQYDGFDTVIDPEDPLFAEIGNMPKNIRDYCERTDQQPPTEIGQYVRCVYESLGITYRRALADIEDCTGKTYPTIYMVGGGSRSSLFCRIIAKTTGRKVVSGPAEATILGNMLVQLMSKGHVKDVVQAREIVRVSEEITTYSNS